MAAFALAAIALAHRAIVLGGAASVDRAAAERWFYAADEASPVLAIGLAAWLVWERRQRIQRSLGRPSPALTALLLAPALVLFVWAQYVGSADVLIPSLSLQLLGFAAAFRGVAGCRAMLWPALVLLLATRIPPPIYNEWVWSLQVWTTSGSSALLGLAGFDVRHADVMIRVGDRALVVVETCSGLRGIQILLLVGITVRELFASSGARMWLVVAIAPALAIGMNMVRVASIALTDDPQVSVSVAEGHLTQGLTVIMVGTIVLYLFGWFLSTFGSNVAAEDTTTKPVGAGTSALDLGGVSDRSRSQRLGLAVSWAVFAAIISFLPLGPSASVQAESVRSVVDPSLSMHHAGWQGRDLVHDPLSTGELALDPILIRRYERLTGAHEPQVVELFVAYADPLRSAASPFSPKTLLPGPAWSIVERRDAHIWSLDIPADLAWVRSGSAGAVVYRWHLRDDGLTFRTLRAIAGHGGSDSTRTPARAVVRLTTPLEVGGPIARDRAKRVLDEFIADFVVELAKL